MLCFRVAQDQLDQALGLSGRKGVSIGFFRSQEDRITSIEAEKFERLPLDANIRASRWWLAWLHVFPAIRLRPALAIRSGCSCAKLRMLTAWALLSNPFWESVSGPSLVP